MSLMHYGKRAFSIDRTSITIETRDPKYHDKIGQRAELSFRDIEIVNYMYKCNARCGKVNCGAYGFQGRTAVLMLFLFLLSAHSNSNWGGHRAFSPRACRCGKVLRRVPLLTQPILVASYDTEGHRVGG